MPAEHEPEPTKNPAEAATSNRANSVTNSPVHDAVQTASAQEVLFYELSEAEALARDPRCKGAVDALNLRIDRASWGVGFVGMREGRYWPDWQGGDAALIVAAEAGGELIDLVACRLRDRAMASRMGAAAILGEDAIYVARISAAPLCLFHDALQWAQGGFRGAAVVDWHTAREGLLELPAITCASRELAARVHQTLTTPPRLPTLAFAVRTG